MKKFYLLIPTVVFLFSSFLAHAQIYTSISPNAGPGAPYTLDDARFWVGGVPPPNPCTGCTIVINSSVTMVPDNGTSSTGAAPGSETSLSDIVLNSCTLQVNGGVTLTINTYLQLFNSSVLIGSDATTAASVILNDQVALNGTSSVQMANVNTEVNVNNDIGNPINGPILQYNGSAGVAGVYYITGTDPKGYDYTLTAIGIGNSTNSGPPGPINIPYYQLNCGGASPNTCNFGLVFGPAVTSFDAVNNYLTFGQATTLPVELVQFVATLNPDGTVKLSWATAQEMNSASFDIERSADLTSWNKIGNVIAKGYSSTTTNYSFTDQFPLAGTGYYRLKMIDLDGKFLYSEVVSVSSDQNSQPLVVYSNPFIDQIRVKVNVDRAENLLFTVSDIVGKTYLKQSYNAQAGDNLVDLVPAGAASGMYILHIEGSTYAQTVKLVKQ
jgi:hypothetical protein